MHVPATRWAVAAILPTVIKAVVPSLAPSAACAAFVPRRVPAAIPSIPTQPAAARRELEVPPRPSWNATDVSAPPEVLACTPPISPRVPVPPAIWNAASVNVSPALALLPPAATQPSPPAAVSAQPSPTAALAAAPAESAGRQPTPPKAVVPPPRPQLATSASVPLPVFVWAAGTV